MPPFGWRQWIKQRIAPLNASLAGAARKQQGSRVRLRLEQLEGRVTPSTVTWINGSGGDWDTTANWSTGSLPTPADDVVIPGLNSGASITHSIGTDAVQSVTSSASISLSGGALTISGNLQIATGKTLTLKGGTLAGATIVSGSDVVLSNSGGTLDGVTIASGATVDGTQNLGGSQATAHVTDGLTLNGAIDLGSANGSVSGQLFFVGANQTLSGSGTVIFGASTSNAIYAQGNGGSSPVALTIGSGIIIQGGGGAVAGFYSNDSIGNDGTIDAAGGTITVTGASNYASGTLTGGTWEAVGGGTLRGFSGAITTDAANIIVSGSNSNIYTGTFGFANALAYLGSVTATGSLTIQGGYNLNVSPGAIPSATLTGGGASMAFDANGDLFVDNGNTVSEFAPGATTPTATLTGLNGSLGMAFDANGDLFVANFGGGSGITVSEFAPGATTPTATLTGLNVPYTVAFDAHGNLFVSNEHPNNASTVSEFAPGATTPTATLTGLNTATGLAFDASGNLFVANFALNAFTQGTTVSEFAPGATTPTATLTGLNAPIELAFDASGNLFVSNSNFGSGNTVSEFAPGATTPTATLTGLNNPDGLAADANNNLFVANRGGATVSVFAPGATTASATLSGVNQPRNVIFDSSGNLYVSSPVTGTVTVFTDPFTLTNAGAVTIGSGSTMTGPAGLFVYKQTGGSTIVNGALDANTVTLAGGMLSGPGAIVANVNNTGGAIFPSDSGSRGGVLTITGNYTQGPGGTLDIDISGPTAGIQYDQLNVSGGATLGGTLNVNLLGSYVPVSGANFKIMSFGFSSGDFATRTGFSIGNGLVFNERFRTSSLSLVVSQEKLGFQTLLPNVVAGTTFAPVQVALLDSAGNVVGSDNTDQVTLSVNQGTLLGTLTEPVVNGVATFSDLSITQAAAGYELTASVTGLKAAVSNLFTVSPAATTQLVFLQQPSETAFGSVINPVVQVAEEDQYNNVETGDSSTEVTLSLANNTAGASLVGATDPAIVSAGVAAFAGLSVDMPGTGYTLQALASSLPAVTSTPFDISLGTTTVAAATPSPGPYQQPVTFTATVSNVSGLGGAPTGSVDFFDLTTKTDLGAGSGLSVSSASTSAATLNISTLSPGNHTIKVTYTPTGTFEGSSGSVVEKIGYSTSTTVATNNNPSKFGEAVTFTASVVNNISTSVPTGAVEFFDGATDLGSGKLVGTSAGTSVFALTTSALPFGGHTISAQFTPSGAFIASGGSTSETVNAATLVNVVTTNGALLQYGPGGGFLQLSPPGTILAASAVTDGIGLNEVYAITADHNLWQHTSIGWSLLSTGYFLQISAATNKAGNAVVFGVVSDHSLWENSSLNPSGGWEMLSAGGSILSISAVTDAVGNDDVYAITADHNLWEHTAGNWGLLSTGSFLQISAGRNATGQAEVFGVLTDNSLWEFDPAIGWQNLSTPGTILSVSAGAPDQVFAITADHHLWQFGQSSGWSMLSAGTFQSISATETPTGLGQVFGTLADTSFWEWEPFFAGDHWRELLGSTAAAGAAPQLR